MCGLAGILSGPDAAPPRRDELATMIAMLHHRGPDGTGMMTEGRVGLAHARLSIVDVDGGAQPIANEDGRIVVVFNGEIFNHVELRAELQRAGHRFATVSDTEVIVHLYEQHGDDFVDHLNGQFAIALWDGHRQRLVLARDRVGIRPLFHLQHEGRLLFASEAKALLALPGVPRALDVDALGDVCAWWAPLAPRSMFTGVQQLPPGHVLTVEADGRRALRCYWDWSFEPDAVAHGRSADDLADELRALLIDAVRLQLRADVPVGAYLSGGLDSSIVAAVVRRHAGLPLRTFSLTFEDGEFDERDWQRRMVEHLGTAHTSVECTRDDIAAAFGRMVWHAEACVLRTAPVPLMRLAGHVQQAGYKVVLTGEGADEVFGGYDLYKEAKVRRFLARQPRSAWRGRLLERLYPYLRHSPVAGRAFTQRFFAEGADEIDQPWFAHVPRMTTARRVRQFLRPELQDHLGATDPRDALAATLPASIAGWVPMGRDQYVEAHTLMTGYLLSSQGDRMAMAHSVEGRYPFLDHRVIEFANRLPPSMKLRGLTEKALLKQAFAPDLPPEITRRTKQPYRAPDSASFVRDGQLADEAAELLSPGRLRDAGLFDADAVGRLVAKCRAGRAIGFGDNMAFVGVLSAMVLHDRFVRQPPAPAARAVEAALEPAA